LLSPLLDLGIRGDKIRNLSRPLLVGLTLLRVLCESVHKVP
jgi:hypothetical protein